MLSFESRGRRGGFSRPSRYRRAPPGRGWAGPSGRLRGRGARAGGGAGTAAAAEVGASLRAEARSVPAARAGRRTQVDWSPAPPGADARCAPRGGGSIPWRRRWRLVPGEPRPGPFGVRGQLAGPRGGPRGPLGTLRAQAPWAGPCSFSALAWSLGGNLPGSRDPGGRRPGRRSVRGAPSCGGTARDQPGASTAVSIKCGSGRPGHW